MRRFEHFASHLANKIDPCSLNTADMADSDEDEYSRRSWCGEYCECLSVD